jgi:hypothetical protein
VVYDYGTAQEAVTMNIYNFTLAVEKNNEAVCDDNLFRVFHRTGLTEHGPVQYVGVSQLYRALDLPPFVEVTKFMLTKLLKLIAERPQVAHAAGREVECQRRGSPGQGDKLAQNQYKSDKISSKTEQK